MGHHVKRMKETRQHRSSRQEGRKEERRIILRNDSDFHLRESKFAIRNLRSQARNKDAAHRPDPRQSLPRSIRANFVRSVVLSNIILIWHPAQTIRGDAHDLKSEAALRRPCERGRGVARARHRASTAEIAEAAATRSLAQSAHHCIARSPSLFCRFFRLVRFPLSPVRVRSSRHPAIRQEFRARVRRQRRNSLRLPKVVRSLKLDNFSGVVQLGHNSIEKKSSRKSHLIFLL